jgi:hypothetical protein
MIDLTHINIDGHVKIWDPKTKEILVSKHNAINPETMTLILAQMLQGNNDSYVYEMHFGNGGLIIDETGNITYNDVTDNLSTGIEAGLYNATYFKVVDTIDTTNNIDPINNKVVVSHTTGLNYTDLVITCTLEENEPNSSSENNLIDSPSEYNGDYIFNELGLKSRGSAGKNTGYLLSHIVFDPVQKSANRVIQVIYTLRIRVN